MKKIFYLLATITVALTLTGCTNKVQEENQKGTENLKTEEMGKSNSKTKKPSQLENETESTGSKTNEIEQEIKEIDNLLQDIEIEDENELTEAELEK